jgi:uncharacterized protein YecE (DUF72 family)
VVTVYVGTSGWQYDDWRDRFYPEDVPKAKWLEFYAQHFAVVESNNAFYRLPKPETFAAWARRTPADFRFTVKASRFLTHIKRLREPAEPVQRFLDHARHLGPKLAPVLLQLPPTLKADLDALDDALGRFGRAVRVAVEFRHPTWFTDECRALLEERGAALCLADGELGLGENKIASRPVTPMWRTTDWGYVRFHHGASKPEPCYGRTALQSWARRIAELWSGRNEVFVFFNNDYLACGVRDAVTLARYLEKEGLETSRTAGARDVRVG